MPLLTVGQCLVCKLPSLFQAELMLDLEVNEIIRLAQESDWTAIKRVQCNDKLSSRLECSQADDKLAHPVADETIGENNVVIKSPSTDLSAMESASAVTQSDSESLKRADSFDSLQARQKLDKNVSNLWTSSNGLAPAADPDVDLSWHGLFPNKEKKKKK